MVLSSLRLIRALSRNATRRPASSGTGGTHGAAAQKAAGRFLRNPLVIAMVLALVLRASGRALPQETVKAVRILALVAPLRRGLTAGTGRAGI